MYATILQCDMHTITAAEARGRTGRALATALAALPGFVAFVALDADAGMVAALCIFEDATSLADAQHRIARWHTETFGVTTVSPQAVGSGAVIVQKGL